MENLRTQLQSILRKAERVCVLAVGSPLRGDDGAGLLAARQFEQRRAAASARTAGAAQPDVQVIYGETAPENFTGEIRRFRPNVVVILDAADMKQPPATVAVVQADVFASSAPYSTHAMPMHVLTNYLRTELGCQVAVLGIQPATTSFGQPPTAEVTAAAESLGHLLADVVAGN